jgi:Domain of unknown function (DUF6321)
MKTLNQFRTEVQGLDEKNTPTSPEKWARAKAAAKSKFAVYPSAYANGWASKKYKAMGGGWKSTNEEKDPEYSDPYMAVNQLKTIMHNAEEMIELIGDDTDLPEWVESKITLAEDYVMTVANYMRSELKEEVVTEGLAKDIKRLATDKDVKSRAGQEIAKSQQASMTGDNKTAGKHFKRFDKLDKLANKSMAEEAEEIFDEIEELFMEIAEANEIDPEVIWEDFEDVSDEELFETAAWRRKEGKDPKGGLNRKGIASYRRENPGSHLSMAVTTKPSKLKPGSKAANRRKSFCARMGGMPGPMKKPNGEPSRKALALRKWNC